MRYILFEIPTPWFTIPIMGYGLMIVLGFVFATALAVRRAKRCGENPEHIMNLALLALVGGIGGARLLYVLGNLSEFTGRGFWGSLLAIVNVRAGGLVYYGGLILATVFALIYINRKKLSTRRMLDILAPSLMLGLAFGRAGCFLNGCCWGGRCTMFEEVQAERAYMVSQGEPAPAPSWLERLITGSLVRFPYGSPAYEQQAQKLPWAIRNAEGQIVGYAVPNEVLAADGSRQIVHTGPSSDSAPSGPSVDVPQSLLRPRVTPLTVTYSNWRVISDAGRVLGYLSPNARFAHVIRTKNPDGGVVYRPMPGPWPLSASQPDDATVVDVPARDIVSTKDGLEAVYSHLGREDLVSRADRDAAATVRSLPVYPAQLYGIFNALLLCAVLSVFFPRRWREGQVFALMAVLYPISRFLLEAVRKDTDLTPLGLTFSQSLSLLVLLGGVVMWVWLYYLPPVARVALTGRRPEAAPAAAK